MWGLRISIGGVTLGFCKKIMERRSSKSLKTSKPLWKGDIWEKTLGGDSRGEVGEGGVHVKRHKTYVGKGKKVF